MPPTVGGRRLCIVMMTLRRPQYACYGSRGTRVWRPWYAYYGDRRTTGKRPEWGQKHAMGIFLKASASLQFIIYTGRKHAVDIFLKAPYRSAISV